jgi:hypothetical protein
LACSAFFSRFEVREELSDSLVLVEVVPALQAGAAAFFNWAQLVLFAVTAVVLALEDSPVKELVTTVLNQELQLLCCGL